MLRSSTIGVIGVAAQLLAIGCAHTTLSPEKATPVAPAAEEVLTLISDTLTIDTTYHSMEGPYHVAHFSFAKDRTDTIWITGITADVVDAGLAPVPVEYFCHANLDLDPLLHQQLFKSEHATSPRLFTLSQGAETLRFPEGFGIPVRTDEPLMLSTQVLSNNGVEAPKDVRVRIRLSYVRNGARPMKALYMTSAIGAVSTDGHSGHYGMQHNHDLPAATAGVAKGSHEYRDSLGQKFTGHWVVPPGEHRVRTVVTKWLNLTRDTDVHYIGVHVHPFAERITLRDLTTGEDVFTSEVTQLADRVGIAKVTEFSSREGIKLRKDHHYELISDYNNPTSQNVDAMAVLLMYARE